MGFPGVTIIENFVSENQEQSLTFCIDSNTWKQSQSGRRKQDYGPKVNFKKQKINAKCFSGLPNYIQFAVEKFKSVEQLSDFQTVELCNLEYEPSRGSSIDPHFDDDWLWGERLVTLNLLSDTWLTMSKSSNDIVPVHFCTAIDQELIEKPIFSKVHDSMCDKDSHTGITFNDIVVKIPLQRRSLVILSKEARYEWKHSIHR